MLSNDPATLEGYEGPAITYIIQNLICVKLLILSYCKYVEMHPMSLLFLEIQVDDLEIVKYHQFDYLVPIVGYE